jgi:hypothetical protein
MGAFHGSSRLRENSPRARMRHMLPSQELSLLENFDERKAIHTRRLYKTNQSLA